MLAVSKLLPTSFEFWHVYQPSVAKYPLAIHGRQFCPKGIFIEAQGCRVRTATLGEEPENPFP
jgi:hypothetical protein